ncbi:histone-like nucleoid-structuring protein Lsr2 [Mycobacteroides abscessus]|uniref:histone-like nucleoid-structuring protein Lsr2 n=1 Tax=Mycobacteroides abscessus TaxID=36809 RepID=UPI000C266E7B|nr:Lsr2 family protein [Mycobacteroides abscessus]
MEQVQTTLIDDVDKKSVAAERIEFGIDGVVYEVDVTEANAEKLRRALEKWIGVARKTGAMPSKAKRGGRRGSASAQRAAAQEKARDARGKIRAWANENGFEVSPRGKIAAHIIEAYELENGKA